MDSNIQNMSEILRAGSPLLGGFTRIVQERLREKSGQQRVEYRREHFLRALLTSKGEFPRMVEGVEVSAESYAKIMACRDIETQLFLAFTRLIKKIAGSCKNYFHTELSFEDLEGAGNVAFVKAMYSFGDGNTATSFSTYVFYCVRREMVRAIRANHPLSPVSDDALEIYNRFEAAKQTMNRHVTFEDVVQRMEELSGAAMTQRELKYLHLMQVRVQSGGKVVDGDNREVKDYSMDESHRRWAEKRDAPDFDALDIVAAAGLNEVEKVVLNAWMKDGTTGWQMRVADELGYTKMSVTKIKERIACKVRAVAPGHAAPLMVITYRTDTYHDKPAIVFGYGKHTFSMIGARAKHILGAIHTHGGKVVVRVLENLVNMTENGHGVTEDLLGVSYGMDKYFGKPNVKFGYGRHTCSLTAAKAKHILRAIKENGGKAVVRALKKLLAMSHHETEKAA